MFRRDANPALATTQRDGMDGAHVLEGAAGLKRADVDARDFIPTGRAPRRCGTLRPEFHTRQAESGRFV